MTTTAESEPGTLAGLPTDPTKLPCGPDSLEVTALHLNITQKWASGSSRNIHLLENGDLGVILARGAGGANPVPHDDVAGHVVVALAADEDHDEVHFTGLNSLDDVEIIGQAIETLVACREALSRVRRA